MASHGAIFINRMIIDFRFSRISHRKPPGMGARYRFQGFDTYLSQFSLDPFGFQEFVT
jgi:hypothetical protein